MEEPGERLEAAADGRRNHHWLQPAAAPAHTHFALLEANVADTESLIWMETRSTMV